MLLYSPLRHLQAHSVMFIVSIGALLSPRALQTFLKCLKLPSTNTSMYLFSICLTLVRQSLGLRLTAYCTLLPLSSIPSANSSFARAKVTCSFSILSPQRAMYYSLTLRSTGLTIWSISRMEQSSSICPKASSMAGSVREMVGLFDRLGRILVGEGCTLIELMFIIQVPQVSFSINLLNVLINPFVRSFIIGCLYKKQGPLIHRGTVR